MCIYVTDDTVIELSLTLTHRCHCIHRQALLAWLILVEMPRVTDGWLHMFNSMFSGFPTVGILWPEGFELGADGKTLVPVVPNPAYGM